MVRPIPALPELPTATHRARMVWPILDTSRPLDALIREAHGELAELAARTGARLVGSPRYTVARAVDVPGSGRVSELVLLAEAPAVPDRRARPYRRQIA